MQNVWQKAQLKSSCFPNISFLVPAFQFHFHLLPHPLLTPLPSPLWPFSICRWPSAVLGNFCFLSARAERARNVPRNVWQSNTDRALSTGRILNAENHKVQCAKSSHKSKSKLQIANRKWQMAIAEIEMHNRIISCPKGWSVRGMSCRAEWLWPNLLYCGGGGKWGSECDLVKLYAERRLTGMEMRIMRFAAVTEHEPKTNPELDTRWAAEFENC